MTTIAYKDGVLATDSQVTFGGSRYINAITKIGKRTVYDKDGKPHNRLAAVCGNGSVLTRFLSWFDGGEIGEFKHGLTDDDATFNAVIVEDKQTLIVYDTTGHCRMQILDYFADGSGAKYALGAMWNGATACQAILAAARHDLYTDNHVQMETL